MSIYFTIQKHIQPLVICPSFDSEDDTIYTQSYIFQRNKLLERISLPVKQYLNTQPMMNNIDADLNEIAGECGINIENNGIVFTSSHGCNMLLRFVYFDAVLASKNPYMEIIKLANNNVLRDGIMVIRIGALQRPIDVDMFAILSGLFLSVGILKPSTNNVLSEDRFIICIGRTDARQVIPIIPDNLCPRRLLKSTSIGIVNRIEESNVVIGYQQISALVNIINYTKKRGFVADKYMNWNECHAHAWCEHYGISYPQRQDKRSNMFRT